MDNIPNVLKDGLLEKLSLISFMNFESSLTKDQILNNIQGNIESENIFGESFEAFQSGRKLFKGEVEKDTFRMKDKRIFLNHFAGTTSIRGVVLESNSNAEREIWLRVIPNISTLGLLALVPIIFFISIIAFITESDQHLILSISLILIIGIAFEVVLYLFARKSISYCNSVLEKNFENLFNN